MLRAMETPPSSSLQSSARLVRVSGFLQGNQSLINICNRRYESIEAIGSTLRIWATRSCGA